MNKCDIGEKMVSSGTYRYIYHATMIHKKTSTSHMKYGSMFNAITYTQFRNKVTLILRKSPHDVKCRSK